MNILDAVRQLAKGYPGKLEAMALRLGKSDSTLRKEISSISGYKLGFEDVEEMTHFAIEANQPNALIVVTTFAATFGQMLVPLPDADLLAGNNCMLRLADTAKEYSELCRETAGDLADGKVSDNEMLRINRQTAALIASLYSMTKSLAALNEAGKPRPLETNS